VRLVAEEEFLCGCRRHSCGTLKYCRMHEKVVETLARFRADPHKVRVGVRRMMNGWSAYVRTNDRGCIESGSTPEIAIGKALAEANKCHMPGVDVLMERAYEHPWGAAGVKARR
jgi:hypothetical protein